jgi:hypothetical protein
VPHLRNSKGGDLYLYPGFILFRAAREAFSGKASEAITGLATLAQNGTAKFQANLISQAAGGCGWTRVQ